MNASAKSSSVATARTYPTGDAADWICRYTPEIESMEELRHVENAVMTFAIVGYRTPEDIVECAERCRSQAAALGGPVEVLVVDNTGLEPVIDRLRQKVDRLVRLKRNVGLCPARNLAAALARPIKHMMKLLDLRFCVPSDILQTVQQTKSRVASDPAYIDTSNNRRD